MTPEETAQQHAERHALCQTSCAIMKKGQNWPGVIVPCKAICQGKRWELVDRAAGHNSVWTQ